MTRLIFVEVFKLRRRVLAKILISLIVLLAVGIQFARWQDAKTQFQDESSGRAEVIITSNGERIRLADPDESPSVRVEAAQDQAVREFYLAKTFPENLEIFRWIVLILGVMLVAGAIGSEYSYGTLRPYLTCAESREKYLGAKFVALGLMITAGLIVALTVAILFSLLFAALNGGIDLGFIDGAYLEDSAYEFVRTLFVVTPYLLIAALAAVVGRSAMVGAVVGLILILVESGVSAWLRLLDSWASNIPDYLLLWNAEAVLGTGGDIVDGRIIVPPDPWVGALVLALYSVAAIALSLWVFNRRDVTG